MSSLIHTKSKKKYAVGEKKDRERLALLFCGEGERSSKVKTNSSKYVGVLRILSSIYDGAF